MKPSWYDIDENKMKKSFMQKKQGHLERVNKEAEEPVQRKALRQGKKVSSDDARLKDKIGVEVVSRKLMVEFKWRKYLNRER